MLWDEIYKALAGLSIYTIILGLIGLGIRNLIVETIKNQVKSDYDRELETHKAKLKSEADIEIEKLKSALAIAASERNVIFSRLHEKRGEVIAEVYSLLKKLLFRVSDYVKVFEPAGGTSREDRAKAAHSAYETFRDYFIAHEIFIPKETCTKIDDIEKSMGSAYNRFFMLVDAPPQSDLKVWMDVVESVKHAMTVAMTELEGDFRHLLGDT